MNKLDILFHFKSNMMSHIGSLIQHRNSFIGLD